MWVSGGGQRSRHVLEDVLDRLFVSGGAGDGERRRGSRVRTSASWETRPQREDLLDRGEILGQEAAQSEGNVMLIRTQCRSARFYTSRVVLDFSVPKARERFSDYCVATLALTCSL